MHVSIVYVGYVVYIIVTGKQIIYKAYTRAHIYTVLLSVPTDPLLSFHGAHAAVAAIRLIIGTTNSVWTSGEPSQWVTLKWRELDKLAQPLESSRVR